MCSCGVARSLERASPSGPVDARGAHFSGRDLRGLNSPGLRARRAELDRADFTGATLAGACFCRAEAREAKFDGADLRGSAFVRANLRGASFAGADLRSADLTGADISEVSWVGARVNEETKFSRKLEFTFLGFIVDGKPPTPIRANSVRGSSSGTLEGNGTA